MRLTPLLGILALTVTACEPKRPPIPQGIGIPMEKALAGQDVFYRKDCVDCHVLDGVGGKMGPSLTGIGSVRDEQTLRGWISDPQGMRRTSSMPRIPLTPEELDLVTSWLFAHK